MDINLSTTSDEPIYRQIFEQLRAQIIQGRLPGGTCLPPIRTVARELRISVITVRKAWEELEHAGLIDTLAGKGCFVRQFQEPERDDRRLRLAEAQMAQDLVRYKSLGLSREEVLALVEKLY